MDLLLKWKRLSSTGLTMMKTNWLVIILTKRQIRFMIILSGNRSDYGASMGYGTYFGGQPVYVYGIQWLTCF
ncbi:MAG: hypothetical protein ACLUR5_18240 [Eubacterium ventriosum]